MISLDPVIAEDLCSALSTDMHAFAMTAMFPLISRVVTSNDIELHG